MHLVDHRPAVENNMISTSSLSTASTADILRRHHERLNQVFIDFFAARTEDRRWDLLPIVADSVKSHLALEAESFSARRSQILGFGAAAPIAGKERDTMESLAEELAYPDPCAEDCSAKVYGLWEMVKAHIAGAEGAEPTSRREVRQSWNKQEPAERPMAQDPTG
jgi:hypothetical protein